VTRLRKMMLEELQGRKSPRLFLARLEDSVVRCDSRGSGVAESFATYAVASIA
jgi:hypothetical protein